MNILSENMKVIEKLVNEVGEQKFKALFDFLDERIDYPESFVTMLGETSSGKSSLLNGLLGQNIIYTGPQPTTGAIVELMDDSSVDSNQFFAVTKEAKLVAINQEKFHMYCKHLPDEYERIRVVMPTLPHGLTGLRLFDTPGYGSIHDKHEQILKSFLPNSDILIYVVNYRVGVNESDAQFIALIEELLQPDVKFYLVINRVPEMATIEDRRVKEIVHHIRDLLHREVPVYLVPGVLTEGDESPLPKAEELWNDVKEELVSPERQAALQRSFLQFQKSLLLTIQGHLEKKYVEQSVSAEEKRLVAEALTEFLAKKTVVDEKINQTFDKVVATTTKLFETSAKEMTSTIQGEITAANRWISQQECAGFVEAHMMPILAKKKTNEVKAYIERELEKLNEEIESMLNTAVQKFESQIRLESGAFEKLVLNVSNRVIERLTNQGLQMFFKQYGGAGGAGAGVANAAKKGLKKLGQLVGKKFSRETHNQLAKTLGKIGATSSRAISIAAIVIVEAAFYLYEVKVWQGKLSKKVGEAVSIWQDKSTTAVKLDLGELHTHNLEQITGFFKDYELAFTFEETTGDEQDCLALKEQIKQTEYLLQLLEQQE